MIAKISRRVRADRIANPEYGPTRAKRSNILRFITLSALVGGVFGGTIPMNTVIVDPSKRLILTRDSVVTMIAIKYRLSRRDWCGTL